MATLVRWEPFRELASMQNELSRFMNGLSDSNGGSMQSWVPTADVWETEKEIVYAFDLPGVSENKITVELDEGALTVSADRERSEEVSSERFYRFERRFGSFSRTIGVPQGVTDEDVSADYRDGVLKVHVKKPEAVKPRRIPVGAGAQATIEGTGTTK
jgi:HSP20 family protein